MFFFFLSKSNFAFQADGGKYLQRRREKKKAHFVHLSCRKTLLAAAAARLLCVLQGDSRG